MKELQKVIATVKGFIANYDYQSLKPAEISIRIDSVELSGTDVLTYTITVQGAPMTLAQLRHSEWMNKSKLNFYQRSPFYPANSDKHQANLSMYDRLWRRSAEKAQELEGGAS